MRRVAITLAGSALVALTAGCPAPPPKPATDVAAQAALPVANVSEEAFAGAVHRLLRDGVPTRERSALLAGVIRRQLAFAGEAFAGGDSARCARAVVGGMYLVRLDEGRADMLDATSTAALTGAIEHFSARGDEGRTLAFSHMQRQLLAPTSREGQRLDEHLAALSRWIEDTRTGGPMKILSGEERRAVAQALVDPSRESLAKAELAISKSVTLAVEINLEFQQTRQLPSRDEAIEAFSSLQAGAYMMAAIYLRHGLALEALEAIERSPAGRITRPSFFAKLRAAAIDNGPEDWRVLTGEFARARIEEEENEARLDPEVLAAAVWGVALEAYRRDPTNLAVAHILATHLVEHGLPEIAPLVLADAVGSTPRAAILSTALEVVVAALAREHAAIAERNFAVASARRIFAASSALLALASQPAYQGKLRTSAADLRRLMANIELKSGEHGIASSRPRPGD